MTSMRVFPSIRSAHMDELDAYAPRPTLYFEKNYDLGGRTIPAHWRRVTRLGAFRAVWTSQVDSLELFEPLWPGQLATWIGLGLTQKLRRGRNRRTVGFFAIENSTLDVLFPSLRRFANFKRRMTVILLRSAVTRLADRIAFGTDMSHALYAPITTPKGPDTTITLDLLAPRASTPPHKTPLTAAFVGELHERKGIDLLMTAWEAVEASLPGAHLSIVGDGPLRTLVASWVGARPQSREYRGVLRHGEVFEFLTPLSVLVAPSVRHGLWREQVGSPMTEALAVGSTIVTTTETGIAQWLSDRRHRVIDTPVDVLVLTDVVIESLKSPLSPAEVLASLPAVDGRQAADAWLHSASPTRRA